ncbi:LysR family transcriptional regulator [Rhodococcus jostii]|uniref:LysR family transcriptional regulator n=1 Tax=Rhodococcus jostii TaxID=132919 RepID=UPI00362B9025
MSEHTYRPTLAQLRAFAAVATHLHFGSAAGQLGISQPTLSQGLATLEAGLGVTLIERSTRRAILTTIGRRLLPHAARALEAADDFVTAASGLPPCRTEPLRIGLTPSVAPYLFGTALPALRARCPEIRPLIVEDHTAQLLGFLRSGALEVAVLPLTPTGAGDLIEIPLYEEAFVLLVPHDSPLAGADPVPLSALDTLSILPNDSDTLHSQARGAIGDTSAHVTSLATAMHCVAGGLGATVVPESAVTTDTECTATAAVRFAAPTPTRTINLVYRGSTGRADHFHWMAEILAQAQPSAKLYKFRDVPSHLTPRLP